MNFNLPPDTTQRDLDRPGVENTPAPQDCVVCGASTGDVWWDRNEEPHACCSDRCARVLYEQALQDIVNDEQDHGVDADLDGEDC